MLAMKYIVVVGQVLTCYTYDKEHTETMDIRELIRLWQFLERIEVKDWQGSYDGVPVTINAFKFAMFDGGLLNFKVAVTYTDKAKQRYEIEGHDDFKRDTPDRITLDMGQGKVEVDNDNLDFPLPEHVSLTTLRQSIHFRFSQGVTPHDLHVYADVKTKMPDLPELVTVVARDGE